MSHHERWCSVVSSALVIGNSLVGSVSYTMSGRPKVYITQEIPRDSEGYQLLSQTCDVTIYDETRTNSWAVSQEELKKNAKGVDALYLAFPVKVNADVLDAIGPQLKVICSQSVGLDHIDLKECARRNIPVGYTPDVLTDAVAEATVGLTIATARRHKEARETVVNGVWGTTYGKSLFMCGKDIRNSVVGIFGLGRIGLGVAKRLVPFGVSRLLYTCRTPKIYANEVSGEFVTFDQLLEESDFIIACCSVNPSNQGIFNAAAFKKMKKTVIFINTSRGTLVNQEDLYAALTSGEILGAGLDVTSPEPIPTDHPLLTLNNCTIMPHIGSASITARYDMVNLSVHNLMAGLKGEPLVAPAPM